MADLRTNEVAEHVAGEVDGRVTGADAVTFVGYLGAGDGEGSYYLWDTGFRTRLEFRDSQIIHQMSGGPTSGGRDYIWVNSDARIAKCQFAPAIDFAGEFATSEDQVGEEQPCEDQCGPALPKQIPPH